MIRLAKDGQLWRLTINRPEKANALTSAMLAKLLEHVKAAAKGPNVLVITGTGHVFSAGADLQEVRAGLAKGALWEKLSAAVAALPCLTITALNGTLAGGAFGMALACDLRVAVKDAEFFYPVMKLGFLPQPSDARRLRALVGPSRAKMILLAGQRIDAREALNWGLVDRMVAAGSLDNTVSELAAAALAAKREHISAIKKLVI